ncbi:MAG: hypothetical protein WBK28_03650 [Minisyncoccia bacterium]
MTKQRLKKGKRGTHVPIRALVLRAIAAGGILALTAAAPKMTQLVKEFDSAHIHRARIRERTFQALRRLKASGLVEITEKRGRQYAVLTDKGQTRVEDILFDEYQIQEPAFWDGKWRIILFDIPERRRVTRNELRAFLQRVGFVRLQDSAWVMPYPCDDCVELIRARIMRGKDELISFVAEGLPNDRRLRAHFRL